jgi:feruloyl-CoA synthase
MRPALLSAAGGLLRDAVLCGADGDVVAALAWLAPQHAHRLDEAAQPDETLRSELEDALDRLAVGAGSASRVERLLLLIEPPVLDAGEITDKGYVNQRAVRDRRQTDVARVLAATAPPEVIVRRTTDRRGSPAGDPAGGGVGAGNRA